MFIELVDKVFDLLNDYSEDMVLAEKQVEGKPTLKAVSPL